MGTIWSLLACPYHIVVYISGVCFLSISLKQKMSNGSSSSNNDKQSMSPSSGSNQSFIINTSPEKTNAKPRTFMRLEYTPLSSKTNVNSNDNYREKAVSPDFRVVQQQYELSQNMNKGQ